jgi:hypothetical protein
MDDFQVFEMKNKPTNKQKPDNQDYYAHQQDCKTSPVLGRVKKEG